MKHKTKITLIGIVTIALLCTTAVHASEIGWGGDGASANLNVSNSGDMRQPALALGPDQQIAVAWAGVGRTATTPKGIYIMTGTGQPTEITSILTGNRDAWAPDLAYHNDQLAVTWVQGYYPYPGTIMQKTGIETPRTVFTPTYGYTAPKTLVGNDRLHMFFASANSSSGWASADLYYTYRRFSDAQWIAPTVIITRAQANPPDGGIWYPHAALSNDKNVVNLVWEQTYYYPEGGQIYRVWYVRGVWNSVTQRFDWGPFTRLSPANKNGVRPKVTVDSADHIHVAWVEQEIDPGTGITHQYINYRRFEDGQWNPPLSQPGGFRLDPVPVQVNGYRPTWSNISMDAQGDTLCVAWHGHKSDPGYEEILMRCGKTGGHQWDERIINASETPVMLSLFPVLKITPEKKIHLVWEEWQGGSLTHDYDTYYRQGPVPREKVYLPLTLRGFRP